MNPAKPSVLLLAVLVDSPALYEAFVSHQLDVTSALLRFLIAVPVCAVMLGFLKGITHGYHSAYLDAKDAARLAAAAEEAEARDAELREEQEDRRAAAA